MQQASAYDLTDHARYMVRTFRQRYPGIRAQMMGAGMQLSIDRDDVVNSTVNTPTPKFKLFFIIILMAPTGTIGCIIRATQRANTRLLQQQHLMCDPGCCAR
jgi:hypothetical protein